MFSADQGVTPTSVVAEAIDFDGTNDYVSRASDLTGNTDGKTFTLSFWIWGNDASAGGRNPITTSNARFQSTVFGSGLPTITFTARNTANTTILSVTASNQFVQNTWNSILISIDLTNTANRALYINDVLISASYGTYVNDNIDFTDPSGWTVGMGTTNAKGGRLSNVYLDYTYRDLSITANRRLFVTADLKPASGQAALNPILYLPMNDPTAPGTNAGTGGNFTLTGTVARSGRGPNQYNAPYSDLDGTADYLSRTTAPTGIADGKAFTFNFCYQPDQVTALAAIAYFTSSSNIRWACNIQNDGTVFVQANNAAGTVILNARATTASSLVVGRNYTITISIDLSNTSNRHLYINGQAASVTWTTYTNDTINFNIATTPQYYIGANQAGTVSLNGRIGAVWFNTSYIDLSVAANLAKFVTGTGIDAKPVDLGASGELPTGTSPLIYLPMYGNNAGKNYGTGGDFTVNSGPYTGARGPNEFWGNKVVGFDGASNNYLTRATSLSGFPSSSSTLTFVCWFNLTDFINNRTLFGTGSAGGGTIQVTSGGNLFFWLTPGYVQFTQVVSTGSWVCLLFSKTGSTYNVYINNTQQTVDVANSFSIGNAISFITPVNIGIRNNGTSTGEQWYGGIAEMYMSTTYIDFSQEANRLLFRDAFGNPTNLPSAITAGTVPNPALYMRFNPASFGTNSGTGGDFTVNGTITDGGQL